MSAPILETAPSGVRWFILDVVRKGDERRPFRAGRPRNDWCALLLDVDPDHLFNSLPKSEVPASSVWLDLGRHKILDAAWDHAEAMIATKH